MKKIYLLLFCVFSLQVVFSQTTVFSEDFEGATNVFNSSSASGNGTSWALTSSISNAGLYADSNAVQLSDTLYLTSNAFSTLTYSYVVLEFYHISKIHLFDNAAVEVSSDNGATWTELTSTEYMGSGFLRSNKYFSSLSYPIWDAATFTSIPQNSWWKKESFDISSVANSANVKIRFVLMDPDNNGSRGSYGWLLDDIAVKAAPCELIPPSITMTGTVFSGNIYSKGPYLIKADIQDASGVSTVQLEYSVDGGPINSINMNNSSGNTFEAMIPNMNYGDTVCYSIAATDNSSCSNVANEPFSGCTSFYVKQGTPTFCTGTVESVYPYTENFDQFTAGSGNTFFPGVFTNNWSYLTNVDNIWYVLNGNTLSSSTGPDFDHTSGFGNYVYVEASGNFNEVSVMESPCFDLSGAGNKRMGFWYHMYGADMGELHIDIETISGTVQDIVPPITGNQGNIWKYKEIDLSAYTGNIVKIKFRGITGNNFRSDIAIDDFTIFEEPADVELQSLVSPSSTGCNGGTAEYVTVNINNLGTSSVDTVPVAYQVNAGTVHRDTAFVNIPSSSSALFTFQRTVNLSTQSSYNFKIWTELVNDGVKNNDTLKSLINRSQITSTMPDTQNFELFTVGVPGVMVDGWMNDATDGNDWYVNSGSTPSISTGPSGDTTSSSGNGNYVYVDAASSSSQFTSLLSPCLDLGNLVMPRMKFFYHMHGAEMGKLHIDVIMNGIRINDIIPPISGDQGNIWKDKIVDLSQFSNTSKIVFRAEKGSGNLGDIALDKIIFYEDPVGMNEIITGTDQVLKFYPNPSRGLIQLEINKKNLGGLLSIKDVAGKLLVEEQMTEQAAAIDLEHLKSGIYFLSYKKGNNVIVEKLILY